jgi:spermidine synthase
VVLGLAAFLLPTLAMGALFSHLAVEAREAGWTFGHGLAANTFGATLAAPLFGVVLLPVAGAGFSLCIIAFCYLLLVPAGASRRRWVWASATAALSLALLGPACA